MALLSHLLGAVDRFSDLLSGWLLASLEPVGLIDVGTEGGIRGTCPPRFCNKQRIAIFILGNAPFSLRKKCPRSVVPPSLRCFLRPWLDFRDSVERSLLGFRGLMGSRAVGNLVVAWGNWGSVFCAGWGEK